MPVGSAPAPDHEATSVDAAWNAGAWRERHGAAEPSQTLRDPAGDGAQGRIRTTDTRIFSPLLYQLSYLGEDAAVL